MTTLTVPAQSGPFPIFINTEPTPQLEARFRERAIALGYGTNDTFVVAMVPNANESEPSESSLFIDEMMLPPGNGGDGRNEDMLLIHLQDYERISKTGSPGLAVTLQAARNEIQRLRQKSRHLEECAACNRFAEVLYQQAGNGVDYRICRHCAGEK